jgi:hypothetical protein
LQHSQQLIVGVSFAFMMGFLHRPRKPSNSSTPAIEPALDADDSTDVIGCIDRLLGQIATRLAALDAVKTELAGLTHRAIEGHTHA